MKIELRHFSYVPEVAASLLGVFLGVVARDPMTTYLGCCCVLTVCFVINMLAFADNLVQTTKERDKQ